MEKKVTNFGSKKRTWILVFSVFLGIQAAVELGIGVALLTSLTATLKAGFGITFIPEIEILGVALGMYLLLLTLLMVLSIIWILNRNKAGVTLGIIIGAFLSIFGVLTFLKFGDLQALLGDSIRGVITILLAFMAAKELKK